MKDKIACPTSKENLIAVLEKNRKHIKKKDLKFFEKILGGLHNFQEFSEEQLEDVLFFMIQLGAIHLVQYELISYVPQVGDYLKKENNKFTFHAFNNSRTFGRYPGNTSFEVKPKYLSQIDLSRLQKEEKSNSTHYIF